MKKFLNIVLSLILVFSFNVPTFAKTILTTQVKYPNVPKSYVREYSSSNPISNVTTKYNVVINKNTDKYTIKIPVYSKISSNKDVNIVGLQIYKSSYETTKLVKKYVQISGKKVLNIRKEPIAPITTMYTYESSMSGYINITLNNLKNFALNNIDNETHSLDVKYIVRPIYRYKGSSTNYVPTTTYSVTAKIKLSNKKINSISSSFVKAKIKQNKKKQLTFNVNPYDSAAYVKVRNSKPAAFQLIYKNKVITNKKSLPIRICDLRNLKITAKSLGSKYNARTGYIYIYSGNKFTKIVKKIQITVSKK